MVKRKTVLAIGGHPDDMEQFAGGTLMLLKNAGCRVVIAVLTQGECGSKTATAEKIVAIRLKESQRAAAIIGAEYINLGIRDGSIEYDLDTATKVVKLLREVQPDVVMTHPISDYMTDHFHTGQLVLWAIPEACHKNFPADTKAPSLSKQPHTYHTDPQGLTGSDGQIARVNTIVDISGVVEKKLQAFAAHKSQMGFLPDKKKRNSVDKTRRWTIIRGEQVRIDNGEGFYQVLHAEYPKSNILKDILGNKVYTL